MALKYWPKGNRTTQIPAMLVPVKKPKAKMPKTTKMTGEKPCNLSLYFRLVSSLSSMTSLLVEPGNGLYMVW